MSTVGCSGVEEDNTATARVSFATNAENTPQEMQQVLENIKLENGRRRSSLQPRTRKQREMVVLMGNFIQVDHWNNCTKRASIYEILGEIATIYKKYPARLSSVDNPLTMVLRDRSRRRTLKILFSADCPPIPNLTPGCLVRCIGKIEHRNIMRAFRISLVQVNEEEHLERIRHVCQHSANGSFT